MRRFVIRVLLFAVLIVVLFGGWSGAILWLELTSYAREAELPADTAYAVCSDSQTEVSLLPALWPRFFNFSLSATQLDQYELKAWGPVDENSKSVKCIKDILALVKAHGVAPVLITTPYHPEFLAKIPREKLENFRGMMNRISQERGVAWFDYLEMTFTDDEWRDGNHLNVHGSVRLTECVRRDVETAVGVGVAR